MENKNSYLQATMAMVIYNHSIDENGAFEVAISVLLKNKCKQSSPYLQIHLTIYGS